MNRADNTVRKDIGTKAKVKTKAYVIKVHEETGSLYLEQEKPAFVGEVPYVLALMVAVTIAIFSCCQYIQLRAVVEWRMGQTIKLEREYYDLKNSNIQLERIASITPELSQVYEIATNELGMVLPNKENTLLFERSNSEYVYQRDNIPKIGTGITQ